MKQWLSRTIFWWLIVRFARNSKTASIISHIISQRPFLFPGPRKLDIKKNYFTNVALPFYFVQPLFNERKVRILLCYWRLFLTFSFLIVRDLDWSIHRLPPPFAGLNCRVWLRPGRPASCYSRSAYQPSRMAFAKVYERDHCSVGRRTHFWHLCGYLTAVGRPRYRPHSFANNPQLGGTLPPSNAPTAVSPLRECVLLKTNQPNETT